MLDYAPRKGINLKMQNTPHEHALGVVSLGMNDEVDSLGIDDNDNMIYSSDGSEECLR